MRESYAHQAVVELTAGSDDRAPAGAITMALCGSLEHSPPCPLAPHHTATERTGDRVSLRILYATDPSRRAEVIERIEAALAAGRFENTEGAGSWQLISAEPGEVRPAETTHAQRLAAE